MAEVLSIGYLAIFAAVGVCIGAYVFSDLRPIVRVWLGLVLGLSLLIWLPALFSFLLGFTLVSQLLALCACVALGLVFWRLARRKGLRLPGCRLRDELPALAALLPLFLFCCVLLSTHTILPHDDGSLWVGQSTYGDLAMHLGFISSIAVQGTFPPMYSICPDQLVGYPFLSSSVGATFCVLGTSLRFATMLTAAYAFLLVIFGVYFFFEAWLKKRGRALFSTMLFFIGGGFGFAYFFDLLKDHPDNLTRAFTAFYETPTNFVENGLRWVNPIADMLIPQRALLFGWALLFPCLYLLYRAAFQKETRLFVPLGVLAGCLPLVHTHSFLALGIVSAFYFCRSLFRNESRTQLFGYLRYLGIVLLLALPQLIVFTFPQSSGSLKFHWNWANVSDGYLWFYIKNFGLIFCLLPVAFLAAKKEDRGFFGGVLLIFAIVETIQFQPNTYDNNKLLFIFYAYSCGLVGNWLAETRQRLMAGDSAQRVSIRVLSAFCCAALFTSGAMTLAREYLSEYQLISADEAAAAEYVKENAEPDATFLTCNNHNNLVAALTGRNIVCGSGSYLFFHGVDYSARESALSLMYEQPSLYFEELSRRYEVDYVLFSSYERANYACDEGYFFARYPVFYENRDVTIYSITA